jgi:hypothetical protein
LGELENSEQISDNQSDRSWDNIMTPEQQQVVLQKLFKDRAILTISSR